MKPSHILIYEYLIFFPLPRKICHTLWIPLTEKKKVLFFFFFLGCPGAKKQEFLTSVLDALSTDMVHAVSDPSSSSGRYAVSCYGTVCWPEAQNCEGIWNLAKAFLASGQESPGSSRGWS